jgi:single-stranded-DNA-specific exonuclease
LELNSYIKQGVERFKNIDNKEVIRVISHLDTDGICSAAILTKAMIRERKKFSITFINYLSEEFVRALGNEQHKHIIFLDLGTSQIKNIKKYLKEKEIYVLDHHSTRIRTEEEGVFHLNPSIYGTDGSKEVSGASVVYLFTKELNNKNLDLAYLGIVGAIGDSQENNGFLGLNNEVLDDAIKSKKINIEKGIRFFGAENKPLYKVLKNSVDIYIPGVTGSDDKALELLESLNIEAKKKGRWTRLEDLEEDQLKALIESIVLKRQSLSQNELKKNDIFGNKYILLGANPEIRDLRELSTMINACGRLDKASVGMGLLLGDKKCFLRATFTLKEYKKEILKAIKWIESKKRTKKVIQEKGYMIINAGEEITPKILGTITSMFTRNREIEYGTYLMGLSRTFNDKIKISFRIVGNRSKVSLQRLLESIVEKFDGECGGHHNAAGGLIHVKHEEKFIETVKMELGKKAMEEVIE